MALRIIIDYSQMLCVVLKPTELPGDQRRLIAAARHGFINDTILEGPGIRISHTCQVVALHVFLERKNCAQVGHPNVRCVLHQQS